MSNQRPPGSRGGRAGGTPRMPADQQQQQAQPEGPNPPANLNPVPPPGQPIVGGVGPNQRPAFNPFNPFNQQQIGVRQRMVGPAFGPQQPQPAFGPQQPQPAFGPQQPQPAFGPQQQQQPIAAPGPQQPAQARPEFNPAPAPPSNPPIRASQRRVGQAFAPQQPEQQQSQPDPTQQQQQRAPAPTFNAPVGAPQRMLAFAPQQAQQPIVAPGSQQPAQEQPAQVEAAQVEAAPQPIVLFHNEARDFYVRHHYNEHQRSHTANVFCDRALRAPEVGRKIYDRGCSVRVPALMYVQVISHDIVEDNDIVPNYFVADDQNREPNRSYRKQCGYHLFVDGSMKADIDDIASSIERVVSCWHWNGQWEYRRWCWKRAPISCLYPTMRVKQKGAKQGKSQLLLGLLFCPDDNDDGPHQRSYERRENNASSYNVMDILENFIDLRPNNSLQYRYNNDALFPINGDREAVTIYVCRGARLALFDDCLYEWNEENKTLGDGRWDFDEHGNQIGPKHCRSLFQQGSLVVVSNCTLELAMQIYKGDKQQYLHHWMDRRNENPILPDIYLPNKSLYRHRKKVLFIGANDSMHNSICWRLRVHTDDHWHSRTDQFKYRVILEAPEGGRLLDVANWNEGFEQIYWRHRYERLPESIVSIGGQPTVSREFGVPRNGGVLNRLHGIQDANEMNVPFPTPVPNGFAPLPTTDWQIHYDPQRLASEQIDCDVRRYIDYSRYSSVEMPSVLTDHWGKGYDKWNVVFGNRLHNQMPPPPVYPPIFKISHNGMVEFQYLLRQGINVLAEMKADQKVYCHLVWKHQDNELASFIEEDDVFQLFNDSQMENNWVKTENVYYLSLTDCRYRLGTDFRYYDRESWDRVGFVNKWCLKRV